MAFPPAAVLNWIVCCTVEPYSTKKRSHTFTVIIICIKKVLDSDWLRAVHFKCNTSAKSVIPVQITHRNSGGSCFLKNSLVQSNSRFNSKPYYYLYK